MNTRVVVLGAGFGGLELSTMLSDDLGDGIDDGQQLVEGLLRPR